MQLGGSGSEQSNPTSTGIMTGPLNARVAHVTCRVTWGIER